MQTRQRQNGGAKVAFARAMGNGVLDLKSLRAEIETAQALARDKRHTPAIRQRWDTYGNTLEKALDIRIELLGKSAESHDRAISGQALPLCREYCHSDPSHRQLIQIARTRNGGSAANTAAVQP